MYYVLIVLQFIAVYLYFDLVVTNVVSTDTYIKTLIYKLIYLPAFRDPPGTPASCTSTP